ncbi:hypothetical protein [Kitasatospora sp. NPDC047058]|uniref:hypothetical protein n=1 Tax=Kitasatospora sp. NPDC047058 TaxID=3155620 RepID=UPI0033DFCA53
MPVLRVNTESGVVVDDPSDEDLHELIDGLSFNGGNDFLVLARLDRASDLYFFQVLQDDADRFVVEYCDGGPENHFGTHAWSVDEVHRMVLAWVRGGLGWPSGHEWNKVSY